MDQSHPIHTKGMSLPLDDVSGIATATPSDELTVGRLAAAAQTASPRMRIADAKVLLDAAGVLGAIVVTADGGPHSPVRGLFMSHLINRILGMRYGVSLYYDKPVASLMNRSPLILDAGVSLHEAARRAMARDEAELYDDIIIVKDGALLGKVGVRELTQALADSFAVRFTQSMSAYETIFRNTGTANAVVTPEGVIMAVNDEFVRLSGYSADELVGAPWRRLLRVNGNSAALPDDAALLQQSATHHALELRRKHGGTRHVNMICSKAEQLNSTILCMMDVTKELAAKIQLNTMAHQDPLTGLGNRRFFQNTLRLALRQAESRGESVALIFIDLDEFKFLNDSQGHPAGDLALQTIAQRFKQQVREHDTIARLGGDEFAVISVGAHNKATVRQVTVRLLEAAREPIQLDSVNAHLGASIGVAIHPEDAASAEELCKAADQAMYLAKDSGKNQIRFYSKELTESIHRQLELERRLRESLERDLVLPYFQPLVHTQTGAIVGVEALARMLDPDGGLTPPSEFIPKAEQLGLLDLVTERILDKSLAYIASLRSAGHALHLNFNISPNQLEGDFLPTLLSRLCRQYVFEPGDITLEITESNLMRNLEYSRTRVEIFSNAGFMLAVDDFGSGYSSLLHIKSLPVRILKVDKALITGLGTDASTHSLAKAAVQLARGLGMQVVGEGVETEADLHALCNLACDFCQGYYFSPPLPAEAFTALLAETEAVPAPPGESRLFHAC